MKKLFLRLGLVTAASLAVMLGLPAIAIYVPSPQTGAALSMLLFYFINPFFVLFVGIFAGRHIKEMWYFCIVPAVIYLISSWLLLGFDVSILQSAGLYLLIGAAAEAGTVLVRKLSGS